MSEAVPIALDIQNTRLLLANLRDEGSLPMFTVTEHPDDWPDFYVARLHIARAGRSAHTAYAIMDRSLERLQTTMEALGLVKLDRSPEDHAVILETWI